jgi:D-alanine transaminase
MSRIAYVNGRYRPWRDATVHIEDRGYQFSDGVYEVCEVRGGRMVDESRHMARLERSLAELRIAMPMSRSALGMVMRETIGRNRVRNGIVYLQITRGVARRDHAFPAGVAPTVFAMTSPLAPVPAEQLANGVAAITLPDERWLHCDIKSTSLLGNVLARQAAVDAGAAECVMFRDGFLTEGAAANVWVVAGGRVLAPPRDRLILEGIRYGLLEGLCRDEGLPFESRPVPRAEVEAADELMLSSATKEVLAITRLDGRPVGSGQPGPVFRRLHAAYQRAKAATRR